MPKLPFLSIAVALSAPALAASETNAPRPLPRQVRALQDCRTKPDAERLACYDSAVDALTAATVSREVVVIDKTEVKEARRGLFGFSLPKLGFLTGRTDKEEADETENRIEAKVAAVRGFGYELWRITLEDGAVWETTETSRAFDDPKVGGMVTIERGSLGSFTIKAGKTGKVKARRIR